MKPNLMRGVIALGIGVALVITATLLQPRFSAGSVPDGVCQLILMPGKLLAVMFHNRGNASLEFLWRSRVTGSIILGGIAFLVLSLKRARRSAISE